MSGVKINPTILTQVREAKQLTQAELADKLETNQANVGRWEDGSQTVNEELFKHLVKIFGVTPEFFIQSIDIQSSKFYRKVDKVPAKIIHAIDANTNLYRVQISALLKNYTLAPADLPALPLSKHETPERAAQQLRKYWKLDKGPIYSLCDVVGKANILIVPIEFNTDKVDGTIMFSADNRPLIFTNKNLLGDRLRFTLAMKLGNLTMHTSSLTAYSESANHEANLFAAEFLMPEKDILPDFKDKQVTLELLMELKKKWRVSIQALLYRAHTLKQITDNQKRYLINQLNKQNLMTREPIELDVLSEKPALLSGILIYYRTKQKLSSKELAKKMYLTEEEFTKRYIG